MITVDILTKDKYYAEMTAAELNNAGYSANIGRSKYPDLIISDLDSYEVYQTDVPMLTYSRDKEADLTYPFLITDLLFAVKDKLSSPNKSEQNEIFLSGGRCYFGEESIVLSPLEFELLSYLYKNKGSVVGADDIARDIFNTDSLNSVRVYIHYLREKLDSKFSRKIILSVHGKGYIIK